ncbi:phage tail family protein [Clostridium botulinum]|uniref:phage tail family protein n=1 Tax=Clostridium botulinum TaxID=1491 RepID=UPI000773B4BD|nr:phage tail family protein [Clostridium botulinum]MBY6952229.1 phage tail family protein [Clostridium botulinum]
MQKLIYRNSKGQEVTLSNSRPFVLEKIENVANTATSINTSISAGQDGVSIDNISIKEKLLPITGGIVSNDFEDIDRKREYLTSIFNPKFNGELIYTNNATSRKIKGRVQDITFQDKVGSIQKFLVQILVPNPFWMDIFEKKEEVALWVGDFEFPLEIPPEGIEMGHRVSNLIVNINNTGAVPCGMRIQFKALATVVNPSLFNVNSREFIKINRTLNAGDVLEVTTDFSNKRIELVKNNGVKQNVFNWIDLDSEFLQLEPGDNLFRYNAESGIDNLEVAIYHTSLYLGV